MLHKKLRLQIWDTLGAEKLTDSLPRLLYRNCAAVIFVFSVSEKRSFLDMPDWITRAEQETGLPCPVLVGNKIDLHKERTVPDSLGSELARDNHMPFFRTSAKTGFGVEAVFESIARVLLDSSVTDVSMYTPLGASRRMIRSTM